MTRVVLLLFQALEITITPTVRSHLGPVPFLIGRLQLLLLEEPQNLTRHLQQVVFLKAVLTQEIGLAAMM